MSLINKFRVQTYNVGIVLKRIDQVLSEGLLRDDIVWLKHSYKDRFFADPFLIDEDDDYFYVLAEEYCFWEEKGRIVLLTIEKESFSLSSKKVLIEEETHLSFPFCEFKGNFIIPESVKSHSTVVYRYNRESKTAERTETILEEGLIDACFYRDKKGNEWIFASKEKNPKSDLYLYKKEKGKYNPCNCGKPIESDIERTRSAGKFFECNGIVYRPVQDSLARYGKQTRILKVNEISDTFYSYSDVISLDASACPPFNETMHTFNVYPSCIIVDGSKDYIRFPMNFFYKRCKFLFSKKRREG